MSETKRRNRLIHATSPYLLQHAHNPVDWYEWGTEALDRARRENKPILVSIGYSSCHWCHVMEREVFEKENMASLMNEHLVCIKVDREERPDIDQVYMEAVQAMGIHGGWPLNVFLTPDQKPFYGGTYFPPDQWVQVVTGVHKAFAERRSDIETSAEQLTAHLSSQDATRFMKESAATELQSDLDGIFEKLQTSFDKAWGGMDKEPKFIMPAAWMWMLRYFHLSGRQEARDHAVFTLKKIAMGGIYDQAGGGFSRYSVDKFWFVPHFEKMLYDNAQLMSLYAEAYALTRDEEFRTIVVETFEWLQSEMMDGHGGFYSALDADSEGEEGKFYTWTAAEIREITGADAPLLADYYSVREEGNWEPGKNILIRVQPEESFLEKHGLSAEAWQRKLRAAKDKLLAVRDNRIHPGLDDKIITSWNAMMAIGLVDAFNALGDESFLRAAIRTMDFIHQHLSEGNMLYRSFKNKRSVVRGFLDDYACVVQANVRLYQATFDEAWIRRAEGFMRYAMDNFHDAHDGYFQYTSRDGEKLIANRKEMFDNVIPSSNAMMARNLFHLGLLLDVAEWKKAAEHMTLSLAHLITQEPGYMSYWGIVYAEIRKGMAEVAFSGPDALAQSRALNRRYQPFVLTLGSAGKSSLPLLRDKTAVEGRSAIYVCYNQTCQRPVFSVEEAAALIV